MEIGMTLPTMVSGLRREDLLAWMRATDAGPFSSLAGGERITYPNQELLMTMAAAASVTERIRLALTVVVLPMHSTGLIAKQLATLDVLSGGRLSVGVGVGGREEDYKAVGASFGRRLARMEEQVALLRRSWAGEPIEGNAAPIGPRPVQEGGPEILAGSLMPKSIRRAARWADGLCGFSFGPAQDEIASAFEVARSAWREEGRTKPPRLVTSCWYSLGPNARGQMDDYVGRYLGFLGKEVASAIAPTCRATSAFALREIFGQVKDAGADELILVPTSATLDQLERVAEVV